MTIIYGIELKSGYNDCWWNVEGRCTFDKYKKHNLRSQRDWDSKENCTVTQLGTQICSNYKKEK